MRMKGKRSRMTRSLEGRMILIMIPVGMVTRRCRRRVSPWSRGGLISNGWKRRWGRRRGSISMIGRSIMMMITIGITPLYSNAAKTISSSRHLGRLWKLPQKTTSSSLTRNTQAPVRNWPSKKSMKSTTSKLRTRRSSTLPTRSANSAKMHQNLPPDPKSSRESSSSPKTTTRASTPYTKMSITISLAVGKVTWGADATRRSHHSTIRP